MEDNDVVNEVIEVEDFIEISESEDESTVDNSETPMQGYSTDESESEDTCETNLNDIDQKVSKTHEVLIMLFEQLTERNKKIDKLTEQIKEYKKETQKLLLSSVFNELIAMRNSIVRNGRLFEERGEDSIPLETFTSYAYDIQDILEANRFDIYTSRQGDIFEPRRQSAIKRIPDADPDKHGKVAYSICDGYTLDDKVISAEKVAVYCYTPESTEDPESTDNNENNDNEINESEENSNE